MNTPFYVPVYPSGKKNVKLLPLAMERLNATIATPGVAMVYSDFYQNGQRIELIDYQSGALRDDFNFGALVAVNPEVLGDNFKMPQNNIEWYELRLRLSRAGNIIHLKEPLYTVTDEKVHDESQFDYVDPRNRDYQIQMERICTSHLKEINAFLLEAPKRITRFNDSFPVKASVIIPVKNRKATIADAVHSALSQVTDFNYNVIVVDNGSTDGTSQILSEINDERLHVISVPQQEHVPGIGGCWNRAIFSDECGTFAVQLDSDDIYSSSSVLQKIIDTFLAERCAMVVGSYTLTDFDLNVIPPGLIDHREWTPDNGRNNLLRVNGIGAPRAFYTPVARYITFPDASYGEDYAMALAISRTYHIGRIYESLYNCRRWHDNTDASLDTAAMNRNNFFKDTLRTRELNARIALNKSDIWI